MHNPSSGIKYGATPRHTSLASKLGAHVKSLVCSAVSLIVIGSAFLYPTDGNAESAYQTKQTENEKQRGVLQVLSPEGMVVGECPLGHTSVNAKISGYVASVTVKQEFRNPYKKKIDVVYSFPLSHGATVDEMSMKVNARIIKGVIRAKDVAREIYAQAKASTASVSLLDQNGQNTFSEKVANVEPGKPIVITLHYEELLSFESGRFTFSFPLVGGAEGRKKISLPGAIEATMPGQVWTANSPSSLGATTAGNRPASDLSMNVDIDAGIGGVVNVVTSNVHSIVTHKQSINHTLVSLSGKNQIPNEDFELTWSISGERIQSSYLTHKDAKSKDGFFTLMLLPGENPLDQQSSPREMLFLVDCSGTQKGAAMEKVKETLKYVVEHMNGDDTLQIIAFEKEPRILFGSPSGMNLITKMLALNFIDSLEGSSNEGNWSTSAVEQALSKRVDAGRLRIVSFMTDGFMGYDQDVIALVKKYRNNAKWFPFAVGYEVNRSLITSIARQGGGEPYFVFAETAAKDVGKNFYDGIKAPILTNVEVDYGDLQVKDVFPKEVKDLWSQQPIYLQGRYDKPGSGVITVSGYAAGKRFIKRMILLLPEAQNRDAALERLWAKAKVDELVSEEYLAHLDNEPGSECTGYRGATYDFSQDSFQGLAGVEMKGEAGTKVKGEITKLGIQHHITTNYTSLVAVDSQAPEFSGTTDAQSNKLTSVEGVNTCGPARINNLANLEALLNLLANAGELMAVTGGCLIAFNGIAGRTRHWLKVSRRKQVIIGLFAIVGGLALPGVIDWLVASARDANLFT